MFSVALMVLASWAHAAKPAAEPMNLFVNRILNRMTVEELAGQLNQVSAEDDATGPIVSAHSGDDIAAGRVGSVLNVTSPSRTRALQKMNMEHSRLKIPLLFGIDAIHGYRTVFPIPLGSASSWDLPLLESAARVTAEEVSADGVHLDFSPMLDVSRDPRWGRVAEGPGEDPYIASQIARAVVHGLQGDHLGELNAVAACAKHFVAYGAALGGRDYNSALVSERALFETYLPPFEAAVRAGVAAIMPAFTDIDGIPSTINTWLLKRILRERWKFSGVVISDWSSVHELIEHGVAENDRDAAALALNAGVNIDMEGYAYIHELPKLVREHKISLTQLKATVRPVLELKYKLGLFVDPYRFSDEARARHVLGAPDNRALARTLAKRSIVLLKNNKDLLPLQKTGKIALIGPFANNTHDSLGPWSKQGDWKSALSLQQSLTEVLHSKAEVLYALGANLVEPGPLLKMLNNPKNSDNLVPDPRPKAELLREAIATAKRADVIVLALGEAQNMSGESASRTVLKLPENQRELLRTLKSEVQKPIVLVLSNGRPLVLEEDLNNADAVLETWFLGSEAGAAIAETLVGDNNPSGHLTMTFPRNEGQIPIFAAERPSGRPFIADTWYVTKYLDAANTPQFPFGFGLSYTHFDVSPAQLSSDHLAFGGRLKAKVLVKNSGSRAGEANVQLYLHQTRASVAAAVVKLTGFQKVELKPGESKLLEFSVAAEDLKFLDEQMKLVNEEGPVDVLVGQNSAELAKTSFRLKQH